LQYYTLANLLRQLRGAYPTILPHGVVGHNEIAVSRTGDRELGRRVNDPGIEFDWAYFEQEGLCSGPAPESELWSSEEEQTRIYGGLFEADQSVTLPIRSAAARPANYDAIVASVKEDLRTVGYRVSTNDEYDVMTGSAVLMFKMRYFSGSRRRASSVYDPSREGQTFDFETAKMLRRVVAALPSS
jgi:N-acetyl-anhydromuramyl-L-alanine amidase AmpD